MIKKFVIFACCLAFTACAKQEISGEKQNFVGDWNPVEQSSDEDSEILLNADGTGHYLMVKPGSKVEFKGKVFFKSSNLFTIGGKIIHKKIKVDKYPTKIIESLKPYKYHYEATFNGVAYTRN